MKFLDHDVSVVDDDSDFAESLQMLLETVGCHVTLYPSGIEYLQSDIRNFHGCVLLDVRMPTKDGLTVLTEALQLNPNLYVVMMSGHGDIPLAVRALKMGAFDFIEKPFQASVILDAMEKSCSRLKIEDRDVQFAEDARTRLAQLTPRELGITEKLVEGKSNKIIAFELGISIRTVETHRARVMAKMQVRSLAELVKMHLIGTA